jgi:hypothetical protein
MSPTYNKELRQKKKLLYKFLLLCLLLAGYFAYLSYEYNLLTGGISALLTWSFFVLCTPIADAGFLLDFPLRLLFGIRMLFSEIAVWCIAIFLNLISLLYFPEYYHTTHLTNLFYAILTNPFPYWGVIILSGLGTFLSIKFGDELFDVAQQEERKYFLKHNYKHKIILLVFFVAALIGYYELIASLGINANDRY